MTKNDYFDTRQSSTNTNLTSNNPPTQQSSQHPNFTNFQQPELNPTKPPIPSTQKKKRLQKKYKKSFFLSIILDKERPNPKFLKYQVCKNSLTSIIKF